MERRDVFSTVYEERIFGSAPGQTYYSGDGSGEQFANSYVELVADQIAQHGITSVVDLGCGDFRIGSRIAPLVSQYRGIDIVPKVDRIQHAHHGSEHVRFECLDIVDDPLPAADLYLIRQVFQHLNNPEILSVLNNLTVYRWSIITENIPSGEVSCPNVDHVHGPKCLSLSPHFHRLPYGLGTALMAGTARH
ncbi:MAG: class I SAM-dependent methyltransferase [Acidobacteriaceae bacterium]|nr:class I SAM-dependent methyltransferase [Acidobacteriaceae bacterium]